MALIENSKIYSGNDLENIFFRPMLAEPTLQEQGIRVLFNMPVPTVIHLWGTAGSVLKPYESGWQGAGSSVKESKTLDMRRVKAESAFSAADYYSQVCEQIVSRPDVNLQDLTGTDLEQAETAIFKRAIADDLRISTWIGNIEADQYNTFDGIFNKIKTAYSDAGLEPYTFTEEVSHEMIVDVLKQVWDNASPALKALKKDGHLVFYLSSDLYQAYEEFVYLNSVENDALNCTGGYTTLFYRGIPVVDLGITSQMLDDNDLSTSQCLLTDSRNLVLALNTSDYPDAEVRMWYNPDQMENRQRAVFLASADFIDFNLISSARA
jgi:hypothetical protein